MTLTVTASVAERDVDVELDVRSGETVALLGPNGAGKSTVLDVVAGMLRPDRGRVVLGGRRLTDVGHGPTAWVPPHDRQVALLGRLLEPPGRERGDAHEDFVVNLAAIHAKTCPKTALTVEHRH